MLEVFPRLFIGNDQDYENLKDEWSIVHACKDPYHRRLLGYRRDAPKTHPEYLFARRDRCLFLNLVDASNVAYIPKLVIDTALKFIEEELVTRYTLVHCNNGFSRAPSIGFLYLVTKGYFESDVNLAIKSFKRIYPCFNPTKGIYDFIHFYYSDYRKEYIIKGR